MPDCVWWLLARRLLGNVDCRPAGGVVAACEGNINKRFCLIVFVVLFQYVLIQNWDKRNIIRSGGYDYKSVGQRRWSNIGVIGALFADVVISYVRVNWAMAGSGQRSKR